MGNFSLEDKCFSDIEEWEHDLVYSLIRPIKISLRYIMKKALALDIELLHGQSNLPAPKKITQGGNYVSPEIEMQQMESCHTWWLRDHQVLKKMTPKVYLKMKYQLLRDENSDKEEKLYKLIKLVLRIRKNWIEKTVAVQEL